jgi:uncharacterized repeat protein (TIGR01451 family)
MVRQVLTSLVAACLVCLFGCDGMPHTASSLLAGDLFSQHPAQPAAGHPDSVAARLDVQPREGVSPVQRQCVLIATLTDGKGEPCRNRRIDWMLEGAGSIVAVDESGLATERGHRVDNRSAVSYTNAVGHSVARGDESFMVHPGQSWCVVSAAAEGDSHVFAYCPEIKDDRRNQVLVTTRWISEAWTFPKPIVARAGSEVSLPTSVSRVSDKQPLAGYMVRYRIVEGPPAVFLPTRTPEFIATTDQKGSAPAALASLGPSAGPNQISVEIIRPLDVGRPGGDASPLVKGETTVTWQAPIVTLDTTAPPSLTVGQELTYTIALSNSGQVESRGMTVHAAIPEGTQYVRSEPAATVANNRLVWTLSELPVGQARALSAIVRTTRVGPLANTVQVETAEGLRGEKVITTDVTAQPQPALKISVEAPAGVTLGAAVEYRITVSNPGTGPATGVVLNSQFDAGLEHESQRNTVEARLGTLAPGETQTVPLTLTARQAGALTNVLTLRADGGLSESARQAVTVKQPTVSLRNSGPAWRYVGRPAEWSIVVENTGEVPLTNLVVCDALSPEFTFQGASDGATTRGGLVTWTIDALVPGAKRTLTMTTLCRSPTPRAVTVASTTPAPGIEVKEEAATEIRGLPVVHMKVVDRDDPVEVGKTTSYRVEVTNEGSLPAEAVQVVALVPDEMRVADTSGPTAAKVEGQHVAFPPVVSLAPGQAVTYTIEVEARKAGTVYFRAELTASTLSKALTEEESTSILPATRETKPAEAPPQPGSELPPP